MYKILIADDEGIVTKSLQYIIEKNFGHSCELCIAHNGRQAIELAESFHPDIALLDIQMPGINGLKAIEEIRVFNPDIKTLILTAYDNFDYAKTALRLGAVDYLIKPINKDLIVEQLTKIMQDIDRKRQKQKFSLQEKEKLETALPIVESSFVLSLIMQNESNQNIGQYRRLLDIEEESGLIMVLHGVDQDGGEKKAVLQDHYRKISEIIRARFYSAYICNGVYNKTICMFPIKKIGLDEVSRNAIIQKAGVLKQELYQKLGVHFKIGIGSVKPWSSMYISYQEALNALRHGGTDVTHIDHLVIQTSDKTLKRMEDAVAKAVMSGMDHEVRREAMVYLGWMRKNRDLSWEEKRMRILSLYLLIRRMTKDRDLAGGQTGDHLHKLLEVEEEETLSSVFVESLLSIARSVVIHHETTNYVIEKSIEYIQHNYHRDLPLEEVAQVAGMSPYYFSKIFKEVTNSNYSEYLTNIRIDMAKKLLSNPTMNIKQICLHIGYTDPNYFSRIFKKHTGLTPTEFRNEL